MNKSSRICAILPAAAALLTGVQPLLALDINKANNNDALDLSSSWQGGSAPGASDVAVWGSIISANRNTALGSDASWGGIRVGATSGGALMSITGTNTLTLGSSGIDMTAANTNMTISSHLVLGAAQTWNVAAGRTLIAQTGTISGSGPLSLTGSGTITMSSNVNTYSGGTTLSGGVKVIIGSSGATNTPFGTGAVTISGTATLLGTSAGSRYIVNPVILNGDLTVGSTSLTSSNFQFLGGIDVGSATRTISIVNNATPTASAPGLYISPSGPMSGTGTLVLANGNAAANPETWVRWGTSGTHAMTANLTIDSGVTVFFNSSNMFTNSSALTVNTGGVFDLSNKGGAAYNQTVKSLAGGGIVTTNKTTGGLSNLTLDGGATTGTTTFTGNIVSGTSPAASVAIIKAGTTTQIFAGSNSYIGQTQVNAGTLLVNGVHIDSEATSTNGYGSATNGHYLVAAGAVLGGSGRIAGNTAGNNSNMVLVQSGGVLAPGASIGTLTLDGANIGGINSRVLTMAAGADFSFELAGNGSSADQIEFWNYASGDVLLNSNEINLTLTGPVVAGTYTVTLFEFYSNNGTTFAASGITSGLTLGTIDPNITGTPTIIYDSPNGTISLQYTVVPEPSICALLAGGFGAVLIFRRRRVNM